MAHRPIFRKPLHRWLAMSYGAVWLWAAVAPAVRFDWFLENLLIWTMVALMIAIYRRFPLSDVSYVLITLFLALHTVGAHYTYAGTPVGYWLQDMLGLERNHYDRVIHFLFGLLMFFPLWEVVARAAQARGRWAAWLTLAIVVSLSALYGIIEWLVAIIVQPDAAIAFLGTQGDVFDAQKDSGLAILGAVIAFALQPRLARYLTPSTDSPAPARIASDQDQT